MGKSNRFYIAYLCVLCVGILQLFASCATTVPAPKSNEDTLLVIPTKTKAVPGTTIFFPGNVRMILEGGGKSHEIYINPLKPYNYVAKLKPGNYMLKSYNVIGTDDKSEASIPFTLEPGKLHVAPFIFLVAFMTEDDFVYYLIKLLELDFKEKKQIIDDLKKDKNTELWEIDYTVSD